MQRLGLRYTLLVGALVVALGWLLFVHRYDAHPPAFTVTSILYVLILANWTVGQVDPRSSSSSRLYRLSLVDWVTQYIQELADICLVFTVIVGIEVLVYRTSYGWLGAVMVTGGLGYLVVTWLQGYATEIRSSLIACLAVLALGGGMAGLTTLHGDDRTMAWVMLILGGSICLGGTASMVAFNRRRDRSTSIS